MLTDMRFGCCAILALSACYAPQVVGGAPCDPSRDSCPTGQTCEPLGSGNFCTTGGGTRCGDAGVDAPPISSDGGTCLGKGLLGSVCLSGAAPAAVTLTTVTINTESTTAGNCREIRAQSTGPSLCLITGTTINVAAGATVRGVGANPLVLLATQSITINGALDVSTHSNETIAGVPALGAGARTAATCFAAGVDGLGGSGSNGGGGAAGGSFGSAGAAGGTGGNNGNTGHGTPTPAAPSSVLIGGCPGGHGGDGSGGSIGGGAGGNAGGAIYLLAGDSITIAGKINASGAGGAGGTNGNSSSGGGGGGGAGGLIGLEAGRITVTGTVFANGGGGGAGGGNAGTGDSGNPGADPTVATSAALGGTGPNNGGNGGAGSVGSTAPVAGKNGTGNFPQCGGGGGGGGAGVVRVFGVPPASLTGTISPPAS